MTTTLTYHQALEIEPKMILEIASGIRDPAIIAEGYGYSEAEWLALQQFEPFTKAVEDKKAELKASGYTFKMKAAIAAEDLLEKVYIKASSDDSSFHTQLETLKFMARAAGIDAPVREQTAAGNGFSITINLGSGQTVQIGAAPRQEALQDIYDVDDTTYTHTMTFGGYTPAPLPT